ncbi:hypothetical protein M3Y99_01719800 [Aphelenchoides fujianensis]|nr:hypothetical protein M3Y99_01719800 [Aphelenchoides fujianensis]
MSCSARATVESRTRSGRRFIEFATRRAARGMRNPEYLRRTTYQNIQRRAKEKYEKALKCGMESVHLTEVDELLLEIIGRDKIATVGPNESDGDASMVDFQALLGLLNNADNPAGPRLREHALLLADFRPSVPPASARRLVHFDREPQQSVVDGSGQEAERPGAANRKRSRLEADCVDDDDEEAALRKQKLRAEIRLLEAQAENQRHETRLKLLQIAALQRDLGLPANQQ